MGCGSSRVVSYSEIDAVTSSVVVPSASVRVTSPAPSSSAFAKGTYVKSVAVVAGEVFD